MKKNDDHDTVICGCGGPGKPVGKQCNKPLRDFRLLIERLEREEEARKAVEKD